MNRIEAVMRRAAEGGYGEDSEFIGKLAGLLASAKFDHGWGPFICGTLGEADASGLCAGYLICPSYGADHRSTQAYMRRTDT